MRRFLQAVQPIVKIKGPAIANALEAVRIKRDSPRINNRLSEAANAALLVCNQQHKAFRLRLRRTDASPGPVEKTPPTLIAPDIEDVAYAAGFFDAEGCANIYRSLTLASGREIFKVQVMAANTNLGALTWLKQRWGGKVYAFPKRPKPDWNNAWQWHAIPNPCRLRFLEDIRPFLKVAGPAADNAISMLRVKQAYLGLGHIYSGDAYASMRAHYERHRALRLRAPRRKKEASGTHTGMTG